MDRGGLDHKEREAAQRTAKIEEMLSATQAATETHLDRILVQTRLTVEERKTSANQKDLERKAALHTPRGFAARLRSVAASGPAILAELKKASPSKGLIRPDFDPAALAQSLERGGAAVLSVLTDEPFFQGSLSNLELASAAVNIPCLRKDFIVDEFQILEARAHAADAVLLIVAALTDTELKHLRAAAKSFDLDVLCEVHNAEELHRVLDLECEAYGVNSRNLKTFDVSLEIAEDLVSQLPPNTIRVAESGLRTYADIDRLRALGYEAFLIGESLMRQTDPGAALRELLTPDKAL